MIISQEQFRSLFGATGPMPKGQYVTAVERGILVALARHAQARTVIEFGVQDGHTAACLMDAVPSIHTYVGIDLPVGAEPSLAAQRHEVPPVPAAAVVGRAGFQLVLTNSAELRPYDLPEADLVFVDGGHDLATVEKDTALALQRVRVGGCVAWHDYNAVPGIGVRTVIDRLNQTDGDRCVLVAGTWMVFRLMSGVDAVT